MMTKPDGYRSDVVIEVARIHVSESEYQTAKSAGIKRFRTAMYEIQTATPTSQILYAMQRHVSIWNELRSAAVEENNWFVVVYCRVAALEMTHTIDLVGKLLEKMVSDVSPSEGVGDDTH